MGLITIYGKRNGKGFDYYKDEKCTQHIGHTQWRYYRKNQVITLNCFKYNLIVIK